MPRTGEINSAGPMLLSYSSQTAGELECAVLLRRKFSPCAQNITFLIVWDGSSECLLALTEIGVCRNQTASEADMCRGSG